MRVALCSLEVQRRIPGMLVVVDIGAVDQVPVAIPMQHRPRIARCLAYQFQTLALGQRSLSVEWRDVWPPPLCNIISDTSVRWYGRAHCVMMTRRACTALGSSYRGWKAGRATVNIVLRVHYFKPSNMNIEQQQKQR